MNLSVVGFTGVAQRKRAGLITPRTPDRNGSPVFVKLDIKRSNIFTALAQGQSARLITWRSSDQNPQAVFYIRHMLSDVKPEQQNSLPGWRRGSARGS